MKAFIQTFCLLFAPIQAQNVALLVGGIANNFDNCATPTSSAPGEIQGEGKYLMEVYGCPGDEIYKEFQFNAGLRSASGVYWPSTTRNGSVMLCGGYDAASGQEPLNTCLLWDAGTALEGLTSFFNHDNVARQLLIVHPNNGAPTALGGVRKDGAAGYTVHELSEGLIWKSQPSLPNDANSAKPILYGESCMAKVGMNVYVLSATGTTIYDLDFEQGGSVTSIDVGDKMADCSNEKPCSCAALGDNSLIISNGWTLDLDTKAFSQVDAAPSQEPITSLNGVPMVFGGAGAGCKSVYKFASGTWTEVGSLKESRTLYSIVEVPAEKFCLSKSSGDNENNDARGLTPFFSHLVLAAFILYYLSF